MTWFNALRIFTWSKRSKWPLTRAFVWSGRRDSNPRPSPWQGDALPTEPRPRGCLRLAAGPDHRTAWRPLTPPSDGGRPGGRARRPRSHRRRRRSSRSPGKSAWAWAMNCCRSSPATGGSGRRLTAAARSRNRASISSTSSEATAATVPGAAERHSGRPASTFGVATLGTVSGNSRFLHRGLTDLGRGAGLGPSLGTVAADVPVSLGTGLGCGRLGPRLGVRAASGSALRRGDVERHHVGTTGTIGAGGGAPGGRAVSRLACRTSASPLRQRRSPITSSGPSAAGSVRVDRTSHNATTIIANPRSTSTVTSTATVVPVEAITEFVGTAGDHRTFNAGGTDTRPSSVPRRWCARAPRHRAGNDRRSTARPATTCPCGSLPAAA